MPRYPASYVSRSKLIHREAQRLAAEGRPVSVHREVRAMLDRERPGHRTHPTEITMYARGAVPPELSRRAGRRVEADGAAYPSLASAAEAHGISREAARKRVKSPRFPGWRLPG
jgi:hypothetical protein